MIHITKISNQTRYCSNYVSLPTGALLYEMTPVWDNRESAINIF